MFRSDDSSGRYNSRLFCVFHCKVDRPSQGITHRQCPTIIPDTCKAKYGCYGPSCQSTMGHKVPQLLMPHVTKNMARCSSISSVVSFSYAGPQGTYSRHVGRPRACGCIWHHVLHFRRSSASCLNPIALDHSVCQISHPAACGAYFQLPVVGSLSDYSVTRSSHALSTSNK